MEALFVENELHIQASIEAVWKTLTDPAITPKYMFGCEIVSDWQPEAPLLWRGVQDGIVYVSGVLKELAAPHRFAFTTYDPQASYPDIPENHLTVTYSLEQKDGGTLVKVTQGDYRTVAEGQKRYDDTMAGGGWSSVLDQVKQIAEARE